MELAVQAGTNFEAAARNGLIKGMSFSEICAAQKVKPETLSPFSHETRSIPEISDETELKFLDAARIKALMEQCEEVARLINGLLAALESS